MCIHFGDRYTMYASFCLTLWDSFMIASFQNLAFSGWWTGPSSFFIELYRVLFIFVKIEIRGNLNVQCQIRTMNVVGYPSCWFFQMSEICRCSDGRQQSSDWPISDAFHWFLIQSVRLGTLCVWIQRLFLQKVLIIYKNLSVLLYTQHRTLLWI